MVAGARMVGEGKAQDQRRHFSADPHAKPTSQQGLLGRLSGRDGWQGWASLPLIGPDGLPCPIPCPSRWGLRPDESTSRGLRSLQTRPA